jgi:hypothetical protein
MLSSVARIQPHHFNVLLCRGHVAQCRCITVPPQNTQVHETIQLSSFSVIKRSTQTPSLSYFNAFFKVCQRNISIETLW